MAGAEWKDGRASDAVWESPSERLTEGGIFFKPFSPAIHATCLEEL